MHKAVEAALASSRDPLSLSIVGGRLNVSVILAFSRTRLYPVWVAKVASGPQASIELRLEHQALELLGPWARELNVPHVLSWDEHPSASASGCCLIFSGLEGFSEHFGLVADTGSSRDGRRLEAALAWLKRLRESVPVEKLKRLSGNLPLFPALSQTELQAGHGPELERLDSLVASLRGSLVPAASHGDFWAGNLLFSGDHMGVIDCERLGVRDACHDVWSLFTHCSFLSGGRVQMDIDRARFLHLYFSENAASRFVRSSLQGLGPSPERLRGSFYAFVAESIRMKGGRFRQSWMEILRELDGRGYPEPWGA